MEIYSHIILVGGVLMGIGFAMLGMLAFAYCVLGLADE